jgi:hypothetical protein
MNSLYILENDCEVIGVRKYSDLNSKSRVLILKRYSKIKDVPLGAIIILKLTLGDI